MGLQQRVFLVAALLCKLNLAAECLAGQCAEDETSLLQVGQLVKQGNERTAKESESSDDTQQDEVANVEGEDQEESEASDDTQQDEVANVEGEDQEATKLEEHDAREEETYSRRRHQAIDPLEAEIGGMDSSLQHTVRREGAKMGGDAFPYLHQFERDEEKAELPVDRYLEGMRRRSHGGVVGKALRPFNEQHFERMEIAAENDVAAKAGGVAGPAPWGVPWSKGLPYVPIDNNEVKWKAEADVFPGEDYHPGEVTDAFEANLKKERERQSGGILEKFAFDTRVREERARNKKRAEERLRADHLAVQQALHADQARIARTRAKKVSVEKSASARVANAKERWEASLIKKHEAEVAAYEGKLTGAAMGQDTVAQQIAAAEAASQSGRTRSIREKQARAQAARKHAQRMAIDKVTASQKMMEQKYVDQAAKLARELEARARARAGVTEMAIEGAEAMKDRLINEDANRDVQSYESKIAANENRIHAADYAMWPEPYP